MKISLLISIVYSYGYKIHGYLGDLLERELSPEAYSRVTSIIQSKNLYVASSWADKVKRTKKYSFTRTLHYMNIDTCHTITEKDLPNGTVYSAINEIANNIPGEFSETPDIDRMKFLIHFIQDLSQPLHSYGKGRGGNSIKIVRNKNGRNRTTNLHTLWDSEIPQTFISSGKYTPNVLNVTLVDVINFNLQISCNYIHNIKDDYIVFEEYYREDIVQDMFDNYLSLARLLL